MNNDYETHFCLSFRHKETGSTYVDATCKTLEQVKRAVRSSAKRGWVLTKKAIETIRWTGFCEYEQLTYQEL